ncbi:MAG TPA: DUF302 domain-containing protein [Tepidisphaeraceae bacterium]|jgi:uncharacterized protein (DUF302 family)
MADELSNVPAGLIVVPSRYDVGQTLDRLQARLGAQGIHVFARIDHAAGAKQVNLPLRPTQVLLLGNPAAGTPLMQAAQTTGIDLPLRALAYEDEAGQTWLAYNDPAYLAARHHIQGLSELIAKMRAGLDGLAHAATAE